MSDPNSTLWPNPLPPASGVNQQLPGIGPLMAKVSQSPNYQKLAPTSTPGGEEKSFGPAGLVPALPAAFSPLGMAAAGTAAGAAPLAGAAYGIGKLVAPKWTDETVGKIKDFLSNKISPLLNKAEATGSAYETGMAESIPGSKFIEKQLPDVSNYLDVIKNQHPQAAWAGHTAGVAGQMALPGANIVKGAGLLGTAANAAINAAPYAIGQGLDVGATTGDVGQAIKSGLLSEGLGTAVPTAISGLSQIPAVSRWLAKVQLAGAGVRTQDITKNLRTYAKSLGMSGPAIDTYVANHSEDLINNAADLVSQYGSTRQGKIALKDWNTAGFDAHDKIYSAITGNHITPGDVASVGSDTDLNEIQGLFSPDDIQSAVKDMGDKIDGMGWSQARNGVLRKYMKAGNDFMAQKGGFAADDPRVLQAAVADAWHDHIDNVADRTMQWAKDGALGPEAQEAGADVPDLHLLKTMYPAVQSIGKAGSREASSISTHFGAGSDTFPRAALEGIIHGGTSALGEMTAGPIGAAAAHFVGPILSRTIGAGLEKGTGALAGALRNAGEVPSAALGRAAAQSGNLIDMLNGPATPTGTTMEAPQSPGEQPQVAMMPIPGAPAGATPIPNAQQAGPSPIPNAAPQLSPQDQAQADFQQAGQAPVNKEGAWNSAFVENRMREKWMRYQRQYGEIPYDQYKQSALQATQGLDPKLPSTWSAMFDDKETGTRLYNGYMNLQKVADVDPGSALNHYTRLFQPGPRLASAEQMKETQDNAKLVQALSDMTKQPVKDIDNRLKQIAWSKGKTPEQKKQAILDMIVKEGGVDVPLLVKMGLWGG